MSVVLQETITATTAIATMFNTNQPMANAPYLLVHTSHVSLPRAIATPSSHQSGALVTMPNTITVNRVTSMKGKERTHAVGAATRNKMVPAIVAAKSDISPPLRNPADSPNATSAAGNSRLAAPPSTGDTVCRLAANETSRFTDSERTRNGESLAP